MLSSLRAVPILLTLLSVSLTAQNGPKRTRGMSDTLVHTVYTGYSYSVRTPLRRGDAQENSYPVVIEIVPGSPADKAGLRVGDEILSINGFDRATRPDSAKYRGANVPIQLGIRRDNSVLGLVITPIARIRAQAP